MENIDIILAQVNIASLMELEEGARREMALQVAQVLHYLEKENKALRSHLFDQSIELAKAQKKVENLTKLKKDYLDSF